MVLARLVIATFTEAGVPIVAAIDDSVTRRSGKKVHGAFWQYDGSATGSRKISRGNCFVTLGIVVHLPFLPRAVCLPVLARLYLKDGPGKVAIAAELTRLLAAVAGDRHIHVVADAAYHGKPLRDLPHGVSWTCRIPRNAVLYELPPRPGGKWRGRPRTKGDRLGQVAELAARRSWKIHALRPVRQAAHHPGVSSTRPTRLQPNHRRPPHLPCAGRGGRCSGSEYGVV
jgi:hypothetical protein